MRLRYLRQTFVRGLIQAFFEYEYDAGPASRVIQPHCSQFMARVQILTYLKSRTRLESREITDLFGAHTECLWADCARIIDALHLEGEIFATCLAGQGYAG